MSDAAKDFLTILDKYINSRIMLREDPWLGTLNPVNGPSADLLAEAFDRAVEAKIKDLLSDDCR